MYSLLFSPHALGKREARNRIVSTSHGTNLANPDGSPSDTLIAYHAAKAAGGCAVVQMFGSAMGSSLGPQSPLHVQLWNPASEPQLRRAAAAVQAHGALAMSQLTSAGRRTYVHAGVLGFGPSDTGSQIAPEIPHVLTKTEIEQIVTDFASSAARLRDCGFDGCDLAFYNDQLADQFWNPVTNQRRDAYGGSLENRLRFSIEVIDAIRSTVGSDFIVGARVSGDDRTNPGLEPAELFEIVKHLDGLRKLDYFTIVGGTIETYRARGYTIPSAYYPKRTFEGLAAAWRSSLATPIILTGRITTPDEAEDILHSGAADFVGMTRAMIADPEMPRKAADGRANEIRQCMSSGEGCIDRLYFGMPIGCVQNAVIGREREWSELVPAVTPKRVAVIGGGPAGMEAARIAARRGHDVTLYEREAELGGAIRIAARAPMWENYRLGVEWQARDLVAAGAAAVTGVDVDLAFLDTLDADAIVFATGGTPRKPYLAGTDAAFAWTAADVLAGRATLRSGRCVIIDETGYTIGPKTADFLVQLGHDVEIITQQYGLGETIGTTLRAALLERLLRAGVVITPMTAAVRVESDGVIVRHVLTDAKRTIPAANVVFACGAVGRDDLYQAFIARPTSAATPECRLIGDAFAPRHLRHAVLAGAEAGRAL